MKNFIKHIPGIASVVSWYRNFKNNPDLIETIQRMLSRSIPIILPPPTKYEQKIIDDLRARMSALPITPVSNDLAAPEKKWVGFKNELRSKVLEDDPRNFSTWEVVRTTMGAEPSRRYFNALTLTSFWQKWCDMLPPVIYQHPYFGYTKTDGATIYSACHLSQLDTDLSVLDSVVDFGGGYGSMCALVHALGFKGTYVLFDWPEFLLLQEFYLKLHHVDTTNITFVSDLSQLTTSGNTLLIATWSLSETPEVFRDQFLTRVNATQYLIAYQKTFAGIDNHYYFQTFVKHHPTIHWKKYPVFKRGETETYLIGT